MKNTHYYPGDIVYVVEMRSGDWKLVVKPCEVEDQYGDVVYVRFIKPKDSRLINDIPIDKFERTKFKKLPKGWIKEANTRDLYKETYDDSIFEKVRFIKVDDKSAIRKGLDDGVLVSGRPTYSVQTAITKDGFSVYIETKTHERTSGSYNWFEIYDDYETALNHVKDYYAELTRQSNLSDEEWSKEQINNTLAHYVSAYHVQPEEERRARELIFSLDRIEDVETRICGGVLQWKYCNKKRWNTV